MKKKLIVDILMFILMLLEFSRMFTGALIHELIGIVLLILVIIHLILNKKYILNIPKAKYNLNNILMLIINILLILSFLLTIVFGILSSQETLTFLNIHNLSIIKLHKILGNISLIIIGIHLGINFNSMFGKIIKLIKNNIVNYILGIIIIVLGIYSSIKVDLIKHVIGEYGFGIKEGNIIINTLEYLSIIMMITILINYIYKRIGERNERKEKYNNLF